MLMSLYVGRDGMGWNKDHETMLVRAISITIITISKITTIQRIPVIAYRTIPYLDRLITPRPNCRAQDKCPLEYRQYFAFFSSESSESSEFETNQSRMKNYGNATSLSGYRNRHDHRCDKTDFRDSSNPYIIV